MVIILPQTIRMKWYPQNKNYYVSKKYVFTKYGDEFLVDVTDLTSGNKQLVDVKCDYCGQIFQMKYSDYLRSMERIVKKSACRETSCTMQKLKEANTVKYGEEHPIRLTEVRQKFKKTMLERYGVDSPLKSETLKEKAKRTSLERFGTEYAMQNEQFLEQQMQKNIEKYGVHSTLLLPEVTKKIQETNQKRYGARFPLASPIIKKKIKKTNIQRYGVEYPLSSPAVRKKLEATNQKKYGVKYGLASKEIQEKVKKTCLLRYGVEKSFSAQEIKEKGKNTMIKRYGVPFTAQSPALRDKMKKTNLKRYGAEYGFKTDEIRGKARRTMYKNGSVPTSKQQHYLHQLIGGELNYPINHLNVDIGFPDKKIYLEYDGGGHDLQVKTGRMSENEFRVKAIKRSYYLSRKGWKEIRIISKKDKFPSDKIILDLIQRARELLYIHHFTWVIIDIEQSLLITKEFKEKLELGELRSTY